MRKVVPLGTSPLYSGGILSRRGGDWDTQQAADGLFSAANQLVLTVNYVRHVAVDSRERGGVQYSKKCATFID